MGPLMHDRPAGLPLIRHGGSLARARSLFPHAPEPWIDLSTGVNPHSYPLFDLPQAAFARLPEGSRILELADLAAQVYGAPSCHNVVVAPGTQILLPIVARLVRPGRAAVLSPTYAEHARALELAGHAVSEPSDPAALAHADIAVVVNPNNPDGRVMPRRDLLELAARLARRGGLLVLDEAFMDVGPIGESLAGDVEQGAIIVLKSFGKFYGLPGVRLGFALAARDVAGQVSDELGPWAVAGPALEYGLRALADRKWREAMQPRLAEEARRLDDLLSRRGLDVTGGTSLFRLVRHERAGAVFRLLGSAGIMVRSFERLPDRLRFGLPANDAAFERLEEALARSDKEVATP